MFHMHANISESEHEPRNNVASVAPQNLFNYIIYSALSLLKIRFAGTIPLETFSVIRYA
jgi:hypothetical protein